MSTAHERLMEHARLIATAGRSEPAGRRAERGLQVAPADNDNVVRIDPAKGRSRRRAS